MLLRPRKQLPALRRQRYLSLTLGLQHHRREADINLIDIDDLFTTVALQGLRYINPDLLPLLSLDLLLLVRPHYSNSGLILKVTLICTLIPLLYQFL